MLNLRSLVFMALAALCGGVTTVSAQGLNVYLAIPGIPGDSAAAGHANEIDVVAVGQGLFEQVSGKSKGVGCDINVTKRLDSAGPLLWMAALGKDVVPEAKITVEKSGAKPLVFYEIRMGSVTISTIGTSFSSDGTAAELVTLLPQSLTLTFREQRPDGTAGDTVTRTFSCGI